MPKVLKIFLSVIIALIIAAGLFTIYVFWDDSRVVTNTYQIYTDKISKVFDEYKIGVVADFHSSGNAEGILEELQSNNPDIICIAGDLINKDTTDFSNAEKLIEGLTEIAPVYYAYGNHEIWSMDGDVIKIGDIAREHGVTVLNNDVVKIEKSNNSFNLCGFRDLQYSDATMKTNIVAENLKSIKNKCDDNLFSVLLFHRPNYAEYAANAGFDLILSGHLHGGVVNFEPVQDMILDEHTNSKKYVKGLYRIDDSQLVVSGGLSTNDSLPRVFNTPEIVMVELNYMN